MYLIHAKLNFHWSLKKLSITLINVHEKLCWFWGSLYKETNCYIGRKIIPILWRKLFRISKIPSFDWSKAFFFTSNNTTRIKWKKKSIVKTLKSNTCLWHAENLSLTFLFDCCMLKTTDLSFFWDLQGKLIFFLEMKSGFHHLPYYLTSFYLQNPSFTIII